jgi:FtsP/CotA-like multicopper oxidase with cupredoxin domain
VAVCRPCRTPCTCTGFSSGCWAAWGRSTSGYLDEGWKDTVLLMPGERVRLMMRFEDYDGLFLYHCHNLEHEDMGMMRNYYVRRA